MRTGSAGGRPGRALLVAPADLPFLSGEDVISAPPVRRRPRTRPVPPAPAPHCCCGLSGTRLDPQYGPDSAARPARLGLPRLDDVPSRLRHDVDDLDDLLPGLGELLSPCTARALRCRPDLESRAS
ncbi:MAG: hypothetical protein NVS3B26_24700 [Mycobacteriales bacterium]